MRQRRAPGARPGRWTTLTPMPITTASPAASARIASQLLGTATPGPRRLGRAETRTSFVRPGQASTAATSRTRRPPPPRPAAAGPAEAGKPGTAAGHRIARRRSAPRAAGRPRCSGQPRPAFCSSAARTAPSSSPATARASRSTLVEPVTRTSTKDRHRPPEPSSTAAHCGRDVQALARSGYCNLSSMVGRHG